jgi:hypothetical protein
VNDKAGAKTPLALVFASLTIALCLIFLTGLLRNLPNVVLAAIVLVAVKGLINVGELRHLWRVSRFEFGVSMVALAGVLVLGILGRDARGGGVAATAHPRAARPRRFSRAHPRFPRPRTWSGTRQPPVAGAIVFRVESALPLQRRARAGHGLVEGPPERSAGAAGVATCPRLNVDVAGARMLAKLHAALSRPASLSAWPGRTPPCRTCCAPKGSRSAPVISAAGLRRSTSSTSSKVSPSRRGRPAKSCLSVNHPSCKEAS